MNTFSKFSRWLCLITLIISGSVLASDRAVLAFTNNGQTQHWTLSEMIDKADMNVITKTPWTDGLVTFRGVSSRYILELVDKPKADIKVTALNDYWAVIPYEDIVKYNPILAVMQNKQTMSIRDKGPIWVIYPLTQYNQLNNEVLHSRMVWQVASIELQP
ncbi:oxidoreductase [Vibrio sp. 11986-1-5]|uniref:oxidoreductase n=1 Tax=Vibrio sp. 11986-1-5 TaxID=2211215 RepID=UPI000D73EE53|nr:oxidoreductase [Vibrio sp. 11986-1-5]PXA71078.1 oxidoreductase [Vibrio sp. 11986-1-5]